MREASVVSAHVEGCYAGYKPVKNDPITQSENPYTLSVVLLLPMGRVAMFGLLRVRDC